MDTRIALKEGTTLEFHNSDSGAVTYQVQAEIGRGGSAIVYNAAYRDNAGCQNIVRIKECYPAALRLTREENGALHPRENSALHPRENSALHPGESSALHPGASEEKAFQKCKEEMRRSYIVHKELFYTRPLTNLITNTLDLYEANNTVYTASVYLQGAALSPETVHSVRDCVTIVRHVACAIRELHQSGYLYLDIKPENIFVLDGITKGVQLFDFDTLVPIAAVKQPGDLGKYRIACTPGFAAWELQREKFRQLGKHTDVYGIGALLFYLLFERVPGAFDCEADAAYPFSSSRFAEQNYQDKLFQALPDFFHRSLASYYLDRYQDMDQVIEKLEEIERYADTVVPFLISSKISCPQVMVGRENELEVIHTWIQQEESNCLFLTGMGGIGKSTLVRAYLAEHRRSFDGVFYLYYNGSVQRMITDDGQLRINIVEQRAEESTADYFYRKVKMLRELTAGKRMLLVVDDFDGEMDGDFREILNIDWKIIVITRKNISENDFKTIRLGAVSEREQLAEMFEEYLRREMEEGERESLETIIDSVAGHTLALQLIARQVECSHISVAEAAELLAAKGFAHMAPEKVDFVKDQQFSYDTVSAIIGALFEAGHMGPLHQAILKVLPFFPMPGIDVKVFSELLGLKSKDEINGLIREGWVQIEGRLLSIHPVVQEVIRQWEWVESGKAVFFRMVYGLWVRIALGSGREDSSLNRQLQMQWTRTFLDEQGNVRDAVEEYAVGKGAAGKVFLERMYRLRDMTGMNETEWRDEGGCSKNCVTKQSGRPEDSLMKKSSVLESRMPKRSGMLGDCQEKQNRRLEDSLVKGSRQGEHTAVQDSNPGECMAKQGGCENQVVYQKKLVYWLQLAEGVLDSCRREPMLRETGEYRNLLYCTLLNLPEDREDYILEHAGELLGEVEKVLSATSQEKVSADKKTRIPAGKLFSVFQDKKQLNFVGKADSLTEDGSSVLRLYGFVISIYEERQELDKAYVELQNAEKAARAFQSPYHWAKYYMILVGYYDALVNDGDGYWGERHSDKVRKIFRALDKAIGLLKKDKKDDGRTLYASALLSKAHILILCYPWRSRCINRLFRQARAIAEMYDPRYSGVWENYNVMKGWYHTWVDRDHDAMMQFMAAAEESVKRMADSDLGVVDGILFPWSNMLYESEYYEEAAEKLLEGIALCEKETYQGVIPYVRKKVYLYACLLDVYYMWGNFEKCREVIGVIDAENERNRELGVFKKIAEDYREEVFRR